MNWSGQDIAAILIALAAALYLAHRVRDALARRRATGCGSCSTCPGQQTPIVTGIGIQRRSKSTGQS